MPDDPKQAAAERICETLRRNGHRALLAGGCVRDMLLNLPAKDYDVATSASPQQVSSLFIKTVHVGAAFGVIVVLLPEGQFEVTTFRSDGPYEDGRHPSYVEFRSEREDAERRDFTINAMFFDPETREVIDYVNGREDLNARIIRTVGDPRQRFAEDHLRLLRAVRFAGRLGFDIEPHTFGAIREMAHLVTTTSPERIRDELTKMLTEGGARRAFELMDETGLLEHVLPEIARMKGVDQPPEYHPEGDVFVHTLMLADMLKGASPTLAFGALLHDVGKPATITYEDRVRFNNHDKVGAEMAEAICKRLRMSNHDTDRIVWLVGQHMRLGHAPQMRESKLKRFVREPGFDELLQLGRMDCEASHGDTSTIAWIENYIANLPPEAVRPVPLITGEDLKAMGFTPGPIYKEILQAVEDAQLEGSVSSPEEARNFVVTRWPTNSSEWLVP
ncbi:MAG: CCA tRNA nucleotidyltransferase [Candidatus Hydrogenedentes bacterium]|nr:CCA tRNA nucleotidyltransferase [Candidatus Hydrogenedentota bacterium]